MCSNESSSDLYFSIETPLNLRSKQTNCNSNKVKNLMTWEWNHFLPLGATFLAAFRPSLVKVAKKKSRRGHHFSRMAPTKDIFRAKVRFVCSVSGWVNFKYERCLPKMCLKSPGTPLKASSAHICPRTFETHFITQGY